MRRPSLEPSALAVFRTSYLVSLTKVNDLRSAGTYSGCLSALLHPEQTNVSNWERESMNILTKALTTGAVFVLASATIQAADAGRGEMEFKFKCAVCHGATGKGDGPYVELLKVSPPDVTLLKKNNGGKFPFERTFQVIDGRADIKAHGTRDMPIWGNEYNDEAVEYYSELYGTHNAELFVQGRILAIITYLQGIQE